MVGSGNIRMDIESDNMTGMKREEAQLALWNGDGRLALVICLGPYVRIGQHASPPTVPVQRSQFTPMICTRYGVDVSNTTPANGNPQLEDIECNISSSPCDPCKELADLKTLMARLIKRESELKRNINHIHSPFIRGVPSEIVAKISEFTITSFTTGLPNALILLTSICSDWRQIVLGTPRLWSSIRINLPFDMVNSKVVRMAAFIDEWLTRSVRLPLHISLCISSNWCGSQIPAANPLHKYHAIFKILNRYSSRWRILDISIPPALFPYLQPDCLPLLEQLNVNIEFQEARTGIHEYILAFPPSPRLKTVRITKTSINFGVSLSSLSNFGIQWDIVTHMSAEWLTIPECLKLLLLIPQLVQCKLHNIVGSTWDNPFLESPIISPLTYLSLSCSQGSLCRFFDNLVLPSLDTLLLSDISPTDSLIACLEWSTCSLHTLSLEHLLNRYFDNLIRLLQLLSPSLEKLELATTVGDGSVDSNQQYLSILAKAYSSQTRGAMGNDFLPHLQIFKFDETFTSSNSTKSLPNLVVQNYSRPVTPIPLRAVYIKSGTIPNPIPLDILSFLERLNEDGVAVTLK